MDGSNPMAVNLVATRGNRVTATILGSVESEIYDHYEVPDAVRKKVRQIILDQLNGYKDLVIDIVKSDSAYINEAYLEQITAIREEISNLKRHGVRESSG